MASHNKPATHPRKSGKNKKSTQENRPCDGTAEPYDSVRPERSMWVAVITQAMMDALTRSHKPEEQFCKFEATNWLTSNSAHFRNVCMMAGMDPDYVRAKAEKALATGTSWRAEAGTGKRYEERKAYRERTQKQPVAPILIPALTLILLNIPCETFI